MAQTTRSLHCRDSVRLQCNFHRPDQSVNMPAFDPTQNSRTDEFIMALNEATTSPLRTNAIPPAHREWRQVHSSSPGCICCLRLSHAFLVKGAKPGFKRSSASATVNRTLSN